MLSLKPLDWSDNSTHIARYRTGQAGFWPCHSWGAGYPYRIREEEQHKGNSVVCLTPQLLRSYSGKSHLPGRLPLLILRCPASSRTRVAAAPCSSIICTISSAPRLRRGTSKPYHYVGGACERSTHFSPPGDQHSPRPPGAVRGDWLYFGPVLGV